MERGDLEQQEIFLSDLRVTVRSSCARTTRYLRRHWSGARSPIVQPETGFDIEVIADGSPRIAVSGEVLWSGDRVEDLVADFELLLYQAALARHEGRFCAFHASALVSDEVTVVFTGESDAGKSSLALAALRRGWKYFSDEFVVTDGRRLWGWPRAIRFNPSPAGARMPDYLADLDTDDDALVLPDQIVPYYAVPEEALQRVACSAQDVRLFSIQHAARSTLTPISTLEGLKHWTDAAFIEPTMSLGALVGAGRSWRASWRDPDELMDLIEKL